MPGKQENFILNDDEIHIWNYSLEPNENLAESYFEKLSEDEKSKAKKIIIKEVKYRSILSKVITRNILSKYLDKEFNLINYYYNEFGKPILSSDINHLNLDFNNSHSGNLGVMAITKKKPIGIDVEQVIELKNLDELINHIFTDNEINELYRLNQIDKTLMFYKIWTAKEAFVKAIGQGLSFPIKNIEFKIDSPRGISIRDIKEFPDSLNEWQIYNFTPKENYTSTIAVKINSIKTKSFVWS